MAGPAPYPNMPVLDQNTALLVLVVNVFLPGIGTIVAGVQGQARLVGRGIAQLLLAIVLVGWVWALVNSVQALTNAKWASAKAA